MSRQLPNFAAAPPRLQTYTPRPRHVVAALRALCLVWRRLPHELYRGKPFCPADFEDEDRVTDHLVNVLADLHSSDALGFFPYSGWDTPGRDAKHPNYDGQRRELMPDIILRPKTNKPHGRGLRFGLFVEAKVIGVRQKGVPFYVRKGMAKFLDGDYGWGMGRGLMVAYVVGDQALPQALQTYFESRRLGRLAVRCRPLSGLARPAWVKRHDELATVHVSRHERRFNVDGACPGEIEIVHLWLQVPSNIAPAEPHHRRARRFRRAPDMADLEQQ